MALSERDWKILRDLKHTMLERFCQVALSSAEQIIQDKTKSYHERYGNLFDFIQQRDKALAIAFDDITKSNALFRLSFMRRADLLTEEEFSHFSEETKIRVQEIVSGYAKT